MKIWALVLVLCAVACGGGNGGSSAPTVCGADDVVLGCFDAVILERNECWQEAAYNFTDHFEEFFYYYSELDKRDGASFSDCAAIQYDFQYCVGASFDEFYTCNEVSDRVFYSCLDPGLLERFSCYSDVYRNPEYERCVMVGGQDCAFHLLLACDRTFSEVEEGCLGDADYAEQDCLTEITDALVCP